MIFIAQLVLQTLLVQMGRSALLIACKLGCINAVKLLLATAGVDVNLTDEVRVADLTLHISCFFFPTNSFLFSYVF